MNNSTSSIAILDIGSNSVRLLITNGVFFNKKLITTRLAENKTEAGELDLTSAYRTVNAIADLKKEAEDLGVSQIYAFATEAVRSAKNKTQFLELVKKVANVNVDVLSGDLEAETGLLGANFGQDGSIIDIGGASTEIAVQKGGQVIYKKSVALGAVALKQMSFKSNSELKSYVDSVVLAFKDAPVFNVKAIGGTSTALASVDLKLKVYDSNYTDGHYIPRKNLEEITSEAFNVEPSVLCERYAITKSRAEVLSAGAYVLLSILKTLGLDGVQVSEKDNLEGYFYKVVKGYEEQ